MQSGRINLITITGPTASGKTLFAANLAYFVDGEIINADSRQVYRRMDIGTGKDYGDYWVNGEQIPYHLIDIHDPGYNYNVYEYQKDFLKAFNDISYRKKMPILAGGTGLYIQSVLEGYYLINVPINEDLRKDLKDKTQEELNKILKAIRPEQHNESDLAQRKRTIRAIEIAQYYKSHPVEDKSYPKIRSIIFGIKFDWYNRRKRITERLKNRLESGLVEEVKELLKTVTADDLIYYGLEYKFVTLYVIGKLTHDEMFEQLNIAIHQLAKRQMTWYRGMEKDGYKIWWLDTGLSTDKMLRQAFDILGKNGQSHLIRTDR